MLKYNPKALDLDRIRKSNSKVTLGFKCPPTLKLELAENAQSLGLTLSEYVENLMTNYSAIGVKERERLLNEIKEANDKVLLYENEALKKLFQNTKNQVIEFKNNKNELKQIKVEKISDLYNIIINSFKISEK